jgi:hypothetical protein
MIKENIIINLTRSEALVFFEWLASADDAGIFAPKMPDNTEQTVLWRIEGQLESKLDEIVKPDYQDLVQAAKKEIAADK